MITLVKTYPYDLSLILNDIYTHFETFIKFVRKEHKHIKYMRFSIDLINYNFTLNFIENSKVNVLKDANKKLKIEMKQNIKLLKNEFSHSTFNSIKFTFNKFQFAEYIFAEKDINKINQMIKTNENNI